MLCRVSGRWRQRRRVLVAAAAAPVPTMRPAILSHLVLLPPHGHAPRRDHLSNLPQGAQPQGQPQESHEGSARGGGGRACPLDRSPSFATVGRSRLPALAVCDTARAALAATPPAAAVPAAATTAAHSATSQPHWDAAAAAGGCPVRSRYRGTGVNDSGCSKRDHSVSTGSHKLSDVQWPFLYRFLGLLWTAPADIYVLWHFDVDVVKLVMQFDG